MAGTWYEPWLSVDAEQNLQKLMAHAMAPQDGEPPTEEDIDIDTLTDLAEAVLKNKIH